MRFAGARHTHKSWQRVAEWGDAVLQFGGNRPPHNRQERRLSCGGFAGNGTPKPPSVSTRRSAKTSRARCAARVSRDTGDHVHIYRVGTGHTGLPDWQGTMGNL